MADTNWKWARLSEKQVQELGFAERTLSPDYLLAFEHRDERSEDEAAAVDLPTAPLDDGQIECLQGLEQKLGVVVVGYRKDE